MRSTVRTCLLVSVACCAPAQKPAAETPVATLDGVTITEKDLKIGEQLIRLDQQAYQLRLQALDSLVMRRLLEKAAAARKLSIEQLAKEIEGMKPEARQAYLAKLKEKSSVRVLLEAPRMPVAVDASPRRGPATAPVTIIEFSDYQCPFCKRAQPVLQKLQASYGNQVSLVYKDLPLTSIHPEAQPAAEAAHCAGEQNKFWEFHDALFAEARITKESYGQIAGKIGLNAGAFQKCLDSGKFRAQLQADFEQARSLGAGATPTFFINGILLEGAHPIESFTRIIDSELKKPPRTPINADKLCLIGVYRRSSAAYRFFRNASNSPASLVGPLNVATMASSPGRMIA